MKRTAWVIFAAAAFLAAAGSVVQALYTVNHRGDWPESWPKALDPLRKQSVTLCGPMVESMIYEIPMTTRTEFESAWPHLLSLKSKGAPIFLVRTPYTFVGENIKAGVVMHTPPKNQDKRLVPEALIPGQSSPRTTWMNTIYIELVVDGNVVDLNRTRLPLDTPIIDERFEAPPAPAPVHPTTRPAATPTGPADQGRPASTIR